MKAHEYWSIGALITKEVSLAMLFKRKLEIEKYRFNTWNGEIIMAKKEERFEIIFRDGSWLKDEGIRQILVDKETGVNYLCWKSGYGVGITPLLDSEGKVIVTK